MDPSYRLLLTGLAWGVAAHHLLRTGLGLGVPLAGALLITAGVVARVATDASVRPRLAVAAAVVLASALAFTLRESTAVRASVVAAAAAALAWAGARGPADAPVHLVGAGHVARHLLRGPRAILAAAPPLEPERLPLTVRRVGVGILMAAPLALVFLVLFAAADPVLASGVRGLVYFEVDRPVERALGSLLWAWLGLGTIVALTRPRAAAPATLPRPGHLESLTVATILTALFAVAVALQMRYLFGGDAYLAEVAGLTRAEYARRGFFELLVIAGLAVPTVVWLRHPGRDQAGEPALTGLLLALVALLGLVLASAAHRLARYHEAFGMSELRLYGGLVELWLAGALVWLGVLVARGRMDRFAAPVAAWGTALVLAAACLNPPAIVQRANIARAASGAPFDARHAVRDLGADGRPALMAGLATLPREARCATLRELVSAGALPARGGAAWTWSRARARAAMPGGSGLAALAAGCPAGGEPAH